MIMNLSKDDLQAIKALIDGSIDERMPNVLRKEVPGIVKPMFEELEARISAAFSETQTQIDMLQSDVSDIKFNIKDIKVRLTRLEYGHGKLKT